MDIRTRSASPISPAQLKQEQTPPPQDKISAYYSLVFPHFTFYIQTLSVTIGRRCAPNPHTATSSTAEPAVVDVDLGALKSVSRLHAKIEYDQDEDRFVLVVIGRNGAWVDGVWSASGTRAPLGERSQIQIASRTFHFILPPPPPPEDTPSPSSQSSNNRARSPSLDITSISPPSSQPAHTPPPPPEDRCSAPPPESQKSNVPIKPPAKPHPTVSPQSQLPNSNAIGKANKATSSKKRKKGETDPSVAQKPKPDEMPPKPPFTYAQLIYRAIKTIGEKATLQEICSWIMNTHEYYQYADGAWMSSVRHNLSSSRAFKKLERCGGDRGKGFFWKLDETHSQALEEQEAKILQASAATSSQGGGNGKGRKKDKGASLLEPPLKRSIKGDLKGGPLPPPLTSLPLAPKVSPMTTEPTSGIGPTASADKRVITNSTQATTGVFAYPSHPQHAQTTVMPMSGYSGPPLTTPNPYAALTQSHWGMQSMTYSNPGASPSSFKTESVSSTAPATASNPGPQPTQVQQHPPISATLIPDVIIPIILGPIPADYSLKHPDNPIKAGYIVAHEGTLILDPDVYSGLTKEKLRELEQMGTRAAVEVLMGHMLEVFRERRAKERKKGRERGTRRGRGTGKRGGAATVGGPFTHAPLERKPMDVNPETNADVNVAVPQVEPPTPIAIPGPDPMPIDVAEQDVGSPIIIVDDSDSDRPVVKRRKVEDIVGQ